MKKIKIALCISNFRQGGAETQFWNIVRGLDREKFEVHIIQFEHHDQRANFHSLPDAEVKTFFARFTFDPQVVWAFSRYVRKNHIKLICSMQFMDNQFAGLVGLLTRTPVITGVRGELKPILGGFKTFFENTMQRFVSGVVTNSYWLKGELVASGWKTSRIHVIYNGIDAKRLLIHEKQNIRDKLGLDAGAQVVGIVARLHPMKAHGVFINAIKQLTSTYPDIKALIIGGGEEEAAIRQQVKEQGIRDNIIFVGEVTEGIGDWFRAMDVLMLTSSYGESFPNVILEAMICSTPVVATDVSAVSEIISQHDNGAMVPIGDWQALAKEAAVLLADRTVRLKYIERGKEKAHELSTQKMVDQFSELFQQLSKE